MFRSGWFADCNPKRSSFAYQPCLQIPSGHIILSFDIWFPTEQDCLSFIKENVLNQGLYDDQPQ